MTERARDGERQQVPATTQQRAAPYGCAAASSEHNSCSADGVFKARFSNSSVRSDRGAG